MTTLCQELAKINGIGQNTLVKSNCEVQSFQIEFPFFEFCLGHRRQLLAEVSKWDSLYDEHFGIQKKTTGNIRDARLQINTVYSKHLKIARVALEARGDLKNLLRIEGRRKQSLPDWLGQVKAFYANYERVADILVKYNITQDIVDQTRAMIEVLESYQVQQSMSGSHAQEATQQRNKFSRELDKWMSEFMYVARLALKDHPQHMEALGKTVK